MVAEAPCAASMSVILARGVAAAIGRPGGRRWDGGVSRVGGKLPAMDKAPADLGSAILIVEDADDGAAFLTGDKAAKAHRMRRAVHRRY